MGSVPGVPNIEPDIPVERSEPHADEVIARLAIAQAGRVARWQLTERGLTRHQIGERLASGHLHSVHRGVYAVGHAASSGPATVWSGVLALGPDARAFARSAAGVWGVRPDNRAVVDVVVPRRARNRPGIRVHEVILAPEDVDDVDSLPVTSLARTFLDLAVNLPTHHVTRALERADKLDLLDASAIDDVCARSNGHRGTRRLREALSAYDPRHPQTRSDLERDALPLLDALDLPRPRINAMLGPYSFDLYWPIERVVVELDGWEHHRSRRAFEDDRARDRWLALHDIERLRITWRQLHSGAAVDIAVVLARRRVRAA
jgi:very-short-patch-repair endonuclease